MAAHWDPRTVSPVGQSEIPAKLEELDPTWYIRNPIKCVRGCGVMNLTKIYHLVPEGFKWRLERTVKNSVNLNSVHPVTVKHCIQCVRIKTSVRIAMKAIEPRVNYREMRCALCFNTFDLDDKPPNGDFDDHAYDLEEAYQAHKSTRKPGLCFEGPCWTCYAKQDREILAVAESSNPQVMRDYLSLGPPGMDYRDEFRCSKCKDWICLDVLWSKYPIHYRRNAICSIIRSYWKTKAMDYYVGRIKCWYCSAIRIPRIHRQHDAGRRRCPENEQYTSESDNDSDSSSQ